jgi:hypothetical protein
VNSALQVVYCQDFFDVLLLRLIEQRRTIAPIPILASIQGVHLPA